MKKKVIVWGIGKSYECQKYFIEDEFDVIGYIDRSGGDIKIEDILDYQFDYVFISTAKYESEIREELKNCGITDERILTRKDMYWSIVPNAEIRDRWVEDKLRKIPDGKVILDAGAGNQIYKKFCSHLKYISQDFGQYDDSEKKEGGFQINEWNSKSVDILSDIIDIPLEDESVDVILCTEVFEHIKNPVLAIKEFARLLKPNGQLLLTAPNCSLTHMAPYYFCNGFSRYWYEENLKDFGFEIEEITENGNYFSYMKQELMRTEAIMNLYTEAKENTNVLKESIKLLDKLIGLDQGSSELLCFGRMVVAKKV